MVSLAETPISVMETSQWQSDTLERLTVPALKAENETPISSVKDTPQSQRDTLAKLTVPALKAECKKRRLAGYSKMKKADLLQALNPHSLPPHVVPSIITEALEGLTIDDKDKDKEIDDDDKAGEELRCKVKQPVGSNAFEISYFSSKANAEVARRGEWRDGCEVYEHIKNGVHYFRYYQCWIKLMVMMASGMPQVIGRLNQL